MPASPAGTRSRSATRRANSTSRVCWRETPGRPCERQRGGRRWGLGAQPPRRCGVTAVNVDRVDVLIVGGGAREHALAWAAHRSPRCGELSVAPGNDEMPGKQVPIAADDVAALTAY